MLYLVIALIVTNLVTLGALAYLFLRPAPQPRPDPRLGHALDGALARATSPTGTRRVISVEILNVGQLAGTRGRLAGIAGSLVPGITARFVYDQTIRTMRRQLEREQVVADLRLHTIARVEPYRPPGRPAGAADGPTDVQVDPSTTDHVETATPQGLRDLGDPGDPAS